MSPCGFVLLAAIAAVIIIDVTQSVFLPKRANGYSGRDSIIDPKKRPFCNAFTGCGKKRAVLPPLPSSKQQLHSVGGESSREREQQQDETIGSLLELSAEPAVEDLSRQIMSEAKLWEAIQEANMELMRRKQESSFETSLYDAIDDDVDNVPTRGKSATANCAIPPCYI